MRVLIVVAALVAAACSAGPVAPTSTTPLSGPTGVPTATPAAPASLAPGAIQFRVVNLYRDAGGAEAPVDVYVRTQGLVQAAAVRAGLAYGVATDYFAPPDPGTVVVTTAGAGDPTCVITCPHFIVESSTNFGEGDVRTIVVYDEGSLELWHDPEPGSVGTTGNALAPAGLSDARLFTIAVGLQDADFGLRLGFDGVVGCQVNRTSEGILVGGNQVGVFAYFGAIDVLLFDNRDAECADPPVGGPFAVSGVEAGTRTMLVLYGRPNEMAGLVLDI